MREIKFRAWSLINRKWVEPTSRYEIGDISFLQVGGFRNGVEVMQYTGFNDKNGKEIYEGDILGGDATNAFVVWVDSVGGWGIRDTKEWRALGTYLEHIEVEVIGNIYENPELLK